MKHRLTLFLLSLCLLAPRVPATGVYDAADPEPAALAEPSAYAGYSESTLFPKLYVGPPP